MGDVIRPELAIPEWFTRNLARQLRRARERRGLSQRQVGRELGTPAMHSMVSKYETGRALPDLKTLYKLAQIYGVRVADFLAEVDFKRSPGVTSEKSDRPRQPR